jgi:hypothetical protein
LGAATVLLGGCEGCDDGGNVPGCDGESLTSDTLEEYSQKCDAAIGLPVPSFNCDDGTLVPTTNPMVDNGELFCDRPNVLNHECDPGSRFQVLARTSDAIVVAHCRKRGLGEGKYSDIAVIQHNQLNGATCFYQALEFGEPSDGPLDAMTTAPIEGNAAGKFPWISPNGTASIKCVNCHDNGPFIRSPYLAQLRDEPMDRLPGTSDSDLDWGPRVGWNKTQPYKFVGNDFQSWKVYEVSVVGAGSACSSCHRMGLASIDGEYSEQQFNNVEGTSLSLGPIATAATQSQKNPHSMASPIWMKPDQIMYDPVVENEALAVRSCAQAIMAGDPSTGGCQSVLFGEGITCEDPSTGSGVPGVLARAIQPPSELDPTVVSLDQ